MGLLLSQTHLRLCLSRFSSSLATAAFFDGALTPGPCPSDPFQGREGRGGGGGERRRELRGQKRVRRLPLPMSSHPHYPPHCGFHRSRRQVSPFLPWPLPPHPRPPHPQGQVSPFYLNAASRFFCTSSSDSGSDAEPHCEIPSDVKEVERVCKVIDDLLLSDRSMEAVLDERMVDLSASLMIGVLERFRHAQKPAYRFFRWAGGRSDFSHNSETYTKMLSILSKTRQFERMVALLEEMGREGFLNMDAFFSAARQMKKSMAIFQMMKRFNFMAGFETSNSLIEALARAKLGKEAQALFEKMKDQYPPDLRTYTFLLLGWCDLKNLVEAGRVWNEMLGMGFEPDVAVYNTMIDGLIRAHRRSDAIKLLELMNDKCPLPNAKTFRKTDLAVKCFQEMLNAGCVLDVATYTFLIVGFGNAQQMDKVSGLMSEMTEKECPPDGYNGLIKLMTNRNMPDEAVRIYKKSFEPSIHTYTMLMKSYFHGNYQMGCAPDVNSDTVFIRGHIRHGRPEEAHKYSEEMISKGMQAPQIDYNKFAADFSRSGKPDILYELAQKMNFSEKFQVSNIFHGWAE